jgi:hypothetical protein
MAHVGPIQDAQLGLLKQFRKLRLWRGSLALCGKKGVTLSVSPDSDYRPGEERSMEDLLAFAREIVTFAEAQDQALRMAVARELLEEYNESWKPTDEPDRSYDELLSVLSLSGIHVQPDHDDKPMAEIGYSSQGAFGDRLAVVAIDHHKTIQSVRTR